MESGIYCVIVLQARDTVYVMAAFESASLVKVYLCLPNDCFT